MNNKILAFSIYVCICLSSCKNNLDGKIVKDADGNIYKITHDVGRCYFIETVDVNAIDSLIKK